LFFRERKEGDVHLNAADATMMGGILKLSCKVVVHCCLLPVTLCPQSRLQ
jgi:hypothetical protein